MGMSWSDTTMFFEELNDVLGRIASTPNVLIGHFDILIKHLVQSVIHFVQAYSR